MLCCVHVILAVFQQLAGTVKLDPVATERSVADGLKEKRKDRSHNIHRTDIFIPFYTYIQMIVWFSCR